MSLGIRTAKEAYLAVLAILTNLDTAKEFVQTVSIWQYADGAGRGKGGQWGYKVIVGRSLNDDNTAPPGAYNWTAPAPPTMAMQVRSRQRWHEEALEAYERAIAPKPEPVAETDDEE